MNSLTPFNVLPGAIGNFTGKLNRGACFYGNPIDILSSKDVFNGNFFIDNEKAYCLNDNEYIESENVPVINADSGLLGTPVREQGYIDFDIIFEPQFYIGQYVFLDSQTEKSYNGFYKVTSIHHKGVISDAVSGTLITSVGLVGYNSFQPVMPL